MVELSAPCPTPNLKHHPLSGVRNGIFNIFVASYTPSWRPFLHPRLPEAPSRGERDPLITETPYTGTSFYLTTRVTVTITPLRVKKPQRSPLFVIRCESRSTTLTCVYCSQYHLSPRHVKRRRFKPNPSARMHSL
jgi:hypothetical protein